MVITALDRTESYGYDASLDYLTSASYGDSLPNQTPTWSYDAAGNRNDAVVDSLNRTTALGGQPVTNDVLGNRLTRLGTTFAWDCLNRLASINGTTFTYKYRADGMRVAKANGSDLFAMRYDGQTLMEERNAQYGAVRSLTRYGNGARGVDLVETTKNSVTTTAFPIYDAHGNQAARLYRSGTGWQVADRTSLDAWGVVRSQQSGTDGRMAYCANLGHQTAEYGLTYMRARYYEPTSGRFVSEDGVRSGWNWFTYASNSPVDHADASGRNTIGVGGWQIVFDRITNYLEKQGITIPPCVEAMNIILGAASNIGSLLAASAGFDAAAAACFAMVGPAAAIGNAPWSMGLLAVGAGATALSFTCKALVGYELYSMVVNLYLLEATGEADQ